MEGQVSAQPVFSFYQRLPWSIVWGNFCYDTDLLCLPKIHVLKGWWAADGLWEVIGS
jgi:hypothetical protein